MITSEISTPTSFQDVPRCVLLCHSESNLLLGPPGLAHDSPRIPNVHISGHRRFKTPPKIHEKTPRERERGKKLCQREKKREILGPPPFRVPLFPGLGLHPAGLTQVTAQSTWHHQFSASVFSQCLVGVRFLRTITSNSALDGAVRCWGCHILGWLPASRHFGSSHFLFRTLLDCAECARFCCGCCAVCKSRQTMGRNSVGRQIVTGHVEDNPQRPQTTTRCMATTVSMRNPGGHHAQTPLR